MRKIVHYIKTIFSWKTIHDTGYWKLQRNTITNELRYVAASAGVLNHSQ